MPERPLFSRDKVEPSASIVLKVRGSARTAAGARHPPSRRLRGQWTASRSASRSSMKRATCSPTAQPTIPTARDVSADERKSAYEQRLREQVESDRLVGGRAGPRPRADHRRFRFQPHHPDLRQIRSRRPRRALEPDARGKSATERRQGQPGDRRQRGARRRPAPGQAAAASTRRATKARNPRKSSITRSPRRPRPR